VERPEPVGDYKVPDGRYLAGMTGRLVELFTDGFPRSACRSTSVRTHLPCRKRLRVARSTGLPVPVATIAEAVGSDVTNVVRSCAGDGRFGAAAQVLSAYLEQRSAVAVSEYTKELIISSLRRSTPATARALPNDAGSRSAFPTRRSTRPTILTISPEATPKCSAGEDCARWLCALPLQTGPRQGRR
jgi:hypothetical protein